MKPIKCVLVADSNEMLVLLLWKLYTLFIWLTIHKLQKAMIRKGKEWRLIQIFQGFRIMCEVN